METYTSEVSAWQKILGVVRGTLPQPLQQHRKAFVYIRQLDEAIAGLLTTREIEQSCSIS